MSNEIMQETTTLVECSAFHRAMSVLEASLRNTEDSEAIINGLLKGVAEFYGASRASVLEADWELGIGVITYEWCKDGVQAQRDMLQCLPMEKFPRWRKALRANKPVVISDLQRLEKVYPDEAAFFREYGVTTLLAAPFSKRINQGFIAVDDPTRYTDDPVFLFIASYAVVAELNEIKQQQSLLAATKASKYNPEDIHINFFGGMEIISSKGTLTGEDIKADQCYLLLAYLILNHKKNFTVDTLAEIICPYDELDSPYKVVNNIVYRLRRTLSVIGLDKLVIGKNGTFQINPNFNIHTDFDRFEDACIQLKTEENPDMRHSLYHSAVDMYKGQLLPRCEHELWLMQLSMYYQSLYLQITKGYVRVLRDWQGRLHPLGKGSGGGRCGVLERTVPGYDRLFSAQCAPDAGLLAVVQRHAGTAGRSASLELDAECGHHGDGADRREPPLVHQAGRCTESIQVGASANDRGFCAFGKCSRRKGRCVV